MRQLSSVVLCTCLLSIPLEAVFAETPKDVNVVNVPLVEVANFPMTEQKLPFSQDVVGSCNDFNCTMDFVTVPDGMMLVIEHVNAVARPTSSSTVMDFGQLVTSNTLEPNFGVRNTFPMELIGVAGDSVSSNSWGLNSSVLAFVRAGSRARVTLTNRDEGSVFFSQASIAGYFIQVE